MAEEAAPIIIDLGKKRRKVIRELKKGQGKAMDEVQRAVEEVRAELGAEAENKVLVPVVLIYRKKQRNRSMLFPGM